MLKRLSCGLAVQILLMASANAACPTFPYTFSNGSTADASQVNANFTNVTSCFAPLANPSFTGNGAISGGLNVTGVLSTSSTMAITGYGATGHTYGSTWQPTSDAQPFPLVFLNAAGSGVGWITTSSTATTYASVSDRRLKENITPTTRGLDVLMRVEIDDFYYINDPNKTRTQGFIAQDLYKIYPEAVAVGGDNPKTQPWGVDYGRLTPLLVRAVQELKAVNDGQAKAIAELRDELDAYKKAHP
jgi:hypothetical protein